MLITPPTRQRGADRRNSPSLDHLVECHPPAPASELSNIHFTIGGPYSTEYADLHSVQGSAR
tara:strand:- start:2472 stop:2657 length:186 start_codon:yes stop_codon:yes gene_type:complete